MPFFREIRCPTNGLILATFNLNDYYYRLSNGIEYPLKHDYAWCHQCESFVECEHLESIAEIEQKLAESLVNQEYWTAILDWRRRRKTPPRCLTCGSFFAIHVLPESGAIEHPDGNCLVEMGFGGHAVREELPETAFFDEEGRLVERISDIKLTNQEVESWMNSVREKHGISEDLPPIEDRSGGSPQSPP